MLGTRIAWLILVSAGGIQTAAKDAVQEQGEFKILVDGKEIGTERYVLAVAGESASSTSILDVKNPANAGKKEHMESKLDMDGQFRPLNYRLTKDVEGKKVSIVGFFSPNQAMFEYSSGTVPIKKGLLVGSDYTILTQISFIISCFWSGYSNSTVKKRSSVLRWSSRRQSTPGF